MSGQGKRRKDRKQKPLKPGLFELVVFFSSSRVRETLSLSKY
jgi:hypothetical protein